MKKIITFALYVVLLYPVISPVYAQSGYGLDENDFTIDREMIHDMLLEGENVVAYMYIQERLKEEYPQNAEIEYGYYTLVRDISLGIGNEYIKVITTTIDISRAMMLVSYQNASRQLADYLLNSSASKGNPNALEDIRARTVRPGAMTGQYSVPGYSGNSRAETHKTICSLCHGKGWIAGSSTPTYGVSGTRNCPDCGLVNMSHSHDRCPACMGNGYR